MLEPTPSTTLRGLLASAVDHLDGAGVASPRREALELWAWASGSTVADVLIGPAQRLHPEACARFLTSVRRRARGEPRQYVTGTASFRMLELKVDSRVLIPRMETEGLVDLALRAGCERPGGRALDVGTGSGCIALSLAVEGDFGDIVAVDSSDAALAVARGNVAAVAASLTVELRQGDLFEPVRGERFDVIVSNPPYLALRELADLDRSVRDYEPVEALASGEDGLQHIRAILREAARHLADGGVLLIEIDSRRTEQTLQLARGLGWTASVQRDVFGRGRYLTARI